MCFTPGSEAFDTDDLYKYLSNLLFLSAFSAVVDHNTVQDVKSMNKLVEKNCQK